MKRPLLSLLLTMSGVADSAPSSPLLLVSFEQPAHVHVNARAPSTLTLSSGAYTRQLTLTGTPDPLDPEGDFGHLDTARVPLPLKAGVTLALNARLFVCDDSVGLCRVEEKHLSLKVTPGIVRLTLKVGSGPSAAGHRRF